MVIRPPYAFALAAVVGLALLWQGVVFGFHMLDRRREARMASAAAVLDTLQPPDRFQSSECEFGGHACMQGRDLPQESIERVGSLLGTHATATSTRCFQFSATVPPECMVLAEVRGVTIAGFLTSRLMPEPPIRFKGSDLWFVTVEGPYDPERYFKNQELMLGPQVSTHLN